MKTKHVFVCGLIAVMTALIFAGCPNEPEPGGKTSANITNITYTAIQTGGVDGTTNSTGIVFTFSANIGSLTATDITVSGAASKGTGALTGSGTSWTLPITVNEAGLASVSIAKNGIETAAKSVPVYKAGETVLEYELIDGGTAYRVRSGTETSGVVEIPATYNGKPVTEIGSTADSIYDSSAFYNTNITAVHIPNSVTSIGGGAFSGCTSLASIEIPESVTSIGFGAFYGWTPSQTIYVRGYDQAAAYAAWGKYWLDGCSAVIKYWDGSAWVDDTQELLYELTDNNTAYSVIGGVRSGAVTIPATYNGKPVTAIGDGAFGGCTSLTSITIPASVTSIGWGAFWGCTSLTSITIPASVTSIDGTAFAHCTGLTAIIVDNNSPHYASEGGILYNKDKTELSAYPSASGTFTIPANVTKIGEYAFYNSISLTSITIPASVTSIGYCAFYGWTPSQTINIQGYISQSAANAAWGKDWLAGCSAVINYCIGIDRITAQLWLDGNAVSLTVPQVNPAGGTVTAQGWQISNTGSGGWTSFTPPSTADMSYNGKYLRYYATISGQTYYSNTVTIRVTSAINFAAVHDSSSQFVAPELAESGTTTKDGAPTYYIKNAKTTMEMGTYEVEITLAEAVDLSVYSYMSFEVATEASGSVAVSLLNEMAGFYPRFKSATDYVQFGRSSSNQTGGDGDDWHTFRESLKTNPTQFARMVFSIDPEVAPYSTYYGPGGGAGVMEAVTVIVLRYICSSKNNFDSAVYFRDFQLHTEMP